MSGASCYPCETNARLDELPPREQIVVHEGWRLAHAFNASLPGWLVAVPLRHVTRFSELTDREIDAFGPLVRAASLALEIVIGCAKTYVVVLGEEVEHVHAHVIPRMPDFGDEVVGTAVFMRLSRPEDEWIPEGERDRLALALRPRIEQALD